MLVGTQMIAKGHDIHGVTLVGVVGADMALGLPISARPKERFNCLHKWLARRAWADSGQGCLADLFSGSLRVQFARGMTLPAFTIRSCNFAPGCIIRRTARLRMC